MNNYSQKVLLIIMLTIYIFCPQSSTAINYKELAEHWAPIIYQDTDPDIENPDGRYDYITSFTFDDDFIGNNNWENSETMQLPAYVYYDVRETETHYYITYAFFHPRDRRKLSTQPLLSAPSKENQQYGWDWHENDMEGAILCVKKDSGYGVLRCILTEAHTNIYTFSNKDDESIVHIENHVDNGDSVMHVVNGKPLVFIEEGGHGVGSIYKALEEDPSGDIQIDDVKYIFKGGDGIVYRLANDDEPADVPNGANDRDVTYKLLQIRDMWTWQTDDLYGQKPFSDDLFDYSPGTNCNIYNLKKFFDASPLYGPAANPPWAWENGGNTNLVTGDFFLDPARTCSYVFNRFDDCNLTGFSHYISNIYLYWQTNISITSPKNGDELKVGKPINVNWDASIDNNTCGINNSISIELSRNGGDTWETIATTTWQSGSYTWNVKGPESQNCLLRIVGHTACSTNTNVYSEYVTNLSIREYDTPALSEGGYSGTNYLKTFHVTYTSEENLPPNYVNLIIVGHGTFPMSKFTQGDYDYTDGVVYVSNSIQFELGQYNYYFCSQTTGYNEICTEPEALNVEDLSCLEVTLSPNPALLGEPVTVTATLTDDGVPIEGEEIQFSQLPDHSGYFTGGTCGAYCAPTNSDGQASITYVPTTFNTIRISAEAQDGTSGYSYLEVTNDGYEIHILITIDELADPSTYIAEATLTNNGNPVPNTDIIFTIDYGSFTSGCEGTSCIRDTNDDGIAEAVFTVNQYTEYVTLCAKMEENPDIISCKSFIPTCPTSICPPQDFSPFDTLNVSSYSGMGGVIDRSGGIRWNPDGRKIAIASGRYIWIVSYPDKNITSSYYSAGRDINDLAWNSDGSSIFCAWEDRLLKIDPDDGSQNLLTDASFDFMAIDYDNSKNNLILVSLEPSICDWTLYGDKTTPCYNPIPSMEHGRITSVAYCPANSYVGVVGPNGDPDVCVFNSSGNLIHVWNNQVPELDNFFDCDWSQDGNQLLASGDNGILNVYNVENNSIININYYSYGNNIYAARFIDNNTIVCCNGSTNTVDIFEISNELAAIIKTCTLNSMPVDLDYDENNKILAVSSSDSKTYIFNLSDDFNGPLIVFNSIPVQPAGTDSAVVSGTITDESIIREVYMCSNTSPIIPIQIDESGNFSQKIALVGDSTEVIIIASDFYRNESKDTIYIEKEPDIFPPTISEFTLTPDSVTAGELVLISARIIDLESGIESDSTFALIEGEYSEVDTVFLNDLGIDGDSIAGDSTFSGTIHTQNYWRGSYIVSIETRDTAEPSNIARANNLDTFYVYVEPDTNPPIITLVTVNPDTLKSGNLVSISAEVYDEQAGVDSVFALILGENSEFIQINMNDNGANGDIKAGDSVYTTQLNTSGFEIGDYDIAIKAKDKETPTNETTTDYSWHFTVVPNRPPKLEPIADIYETAGNPVIIVANATDPDGDDIIYSINDSNFVQNDNIFTWYTSKSDTGYYNPIIYASDGELLDSISVNINLKSSIIIHDAMSDSSETFFNWKYNLVTWHSDYNGFLTTSSSSWEAGCISSIGFTTEDMPTVVIRFEQSSNAIFGFRNYPHNPENGSNDFSWTKMTNAIYQHSSGRMILIHDGSTESSDVDTLKESGYYDLKIRINCEDGSLIYTVDGPVEYNDPISNFNDPVFTYIDHDAIAWNDTIWLQLALYNGSKVYDVWYWNNREPSIEMEEQISYYYDQEVKIIVNASDPDADSLIYFIDDPKFSQNGNIFTWTPTLTDTGTYHLMVGASDGCAESYKQLTLKIIERSRGCHDPLIANNHGEFGWFENNVIWHEDSLGYLTGIAGSNWKSAIISSKNYNSSENPYFIMRTNVKSSEISSGKMIGFTVNTPPSNDYHFSNMSYYIYIVSSGKVYIGTGDIYNYIDPNISLQDGLYDVKIQIDYSSGQILYAIDSVQSIDSPLSDFNIVQWKGSITANLAPNYHLQINMYLDKSRVFDVWESPYITDAETPLVQTPVLMQNYPNPFNPITTIKFALDKDENVKLSIYDVSGKLIRKLLDTRLKKGWHNVTWDGKDSEGKPVTSGVYFYMLSTSGYRETRKMILLR